MVRPRPLAGQRHVAPAEQADSRDRVVRGATGARHDPRQAVAGAAGDAMDVGGVEGLGEGHGRQDRGEPAGQPRRARSGWTQKQDVVGTTPAYYFASPMSLRMPMDLLLNLLVKLENQCRAIS
jgi:hypothetical protein